MFSSATVSKGGKFNCLKMNYDDTGGKAFTYESNYSGPIKTRSCTDVFCLIIFVLFVIIWCILFFFAMRYSDPRLLIYPQDYQGRYCGLSKEVNKKPYLFYYDLLECDPVKVNFMKCHSKYVCVEDCPRHTFSATRVAGGEDFGEITSGNYKDHLICNEANITDFEDAIKRKACANIYMKSIPVLRRCIPRLEAFNSSMIDELYEKNSKLNPMNQLMRILNGLSYYRSIPEKIVADFNATRFQLLIALILSMVICLLWIIFMGWYTTAVVWASIFGIYAFLVFGIYSCYTNYVQLNQPPLNCSDDISLQNESVGSKCSLWKYGGIGLLIGTVILSLILFYVRNKILLAIELIREASSSVLAYSLVLLYPIIPFVLEVSVFFLCGFFSLNVISLGATEYSGNSSGYSFIREFCENSSYGGASPDYQNYSTYEVNIICTLLKIGGRWSITLLNLYNLFALFWTVSFLKGLNHIVLAGVFAAYYWTFRKPDDLPALALPWSFYRTVRFHLGSIALGGFLISVTKYIRLLLEYIYRSTKGSENPFSKLVVKACSCCLWLFEKFIKFISKNAYIMIASFGYNFCKGAREAFLLLMRNVVRVVVLNKITDLVLFLGKLKIVLLMGILSYFYFSGKIVKDVPTVHYLANPIIIICIGSYIVSTIFFQVFHVAVDTLFLCFLEDCERNDGSPERPYFMPRKLMKLLGKSNSFRSPEEYATVKTIVPSGSHS